MVPILIFKTANNITRNILSAKCALKIVCDNYVLNFAIIIVDNLQIIEIIIEEQLEFYEFGMPLQLLKKKNRNQLPGSFPGFREAFYPVKVRDDLGLQR